MNGTLEVHQLEAPSLVGNPLGDPSTRKLVVYVPAGYATTSAGLPAVYFLHGFSGTVEGWTNVSPFGVTVPERLDALVEAGKVPPFLGVFIDGWTALGGSQWINSEAIGRYQDYVADDVVRFVDAHYRTLASPTGRAVMGKSSGGYGSLAMVRDRSDVFAHVACHSGDSAFEYCYLGDFVKSAGPLLQAGGPDVWLKDFLRRSKETKGRGDDFPVINTLAMAASYSPRMGQPLNLELPFDANTARLKPDVWSRWLEQDPVRYLPKHLETFRKLKSVFIDCGSRDEYSLRWGTRMVEEELKKGGVDVVHEEFEDGHMGTSYRYARSVSYVVPRMG